MLGAEADENAGAARYERNKDIKAYRVSSYERRLAANERDSHRHLEQISGSMAAHRKRADYRTSRQA